jgi:hypothetical protein
LLSLFQILQPPTLLSKPTTNIANKPTTTHSNILRDTNNMKLLPVFTTLLGTALSVRATAIPDTSNDNCPEACSSRYNGCMSQFPPDFVKSCQFNVCMWWKEKAAVSTH